MSKPASEASLSETDYPIPSLFEAPESEPDETEDEDPPDNDAECSMGCDWPEGPLSPSGCRW